PKWLQEMFTVDPPGQKPRKQRRPKAKSAQPAARASGTDVRLPATAPVPEPAQRDVNSAAVPTAMPGEASRRPAPVEASTAPDAQISSNVPAQSVQARESGAAAPPK